MNDRYEKHLKDLREQYINATPNQRMRVILDRINQPDCLPNKLVNIVSAVECLARAISLEIRQFQGMSKIEAYNGIIVGKISIRNAGHKLLISKVISPFIEKTPDELFGSDNWKTFNHAVEYRNLLIHEGAFLRHGYATELINVCQVIFRKLSELDLMPHR